MTPRVHRSRVTHDRWLVSYADFITLLFAFFVVLYAFAKADQKKQADVSQAIDGAFRSLGVFSNAPQPAQQNAGSAAASVHAVVQDDVVSPEKVRDDLEQMQRTLEQKLADPVARRTVAITMGREGLVISLREAGFFDSGSAVPRPATFDTIRTIATSIGQTPYDIRVEGHTDNVPMHTDAFDSNWELSSARATGIARRMLALHALPPERLSCAGYAEFHPIDSNDSPEGRAHNRRVDIIVLPRTRLNLAAAHAASSSGAWARITDE
ncbi:MAG TPA: flagellar motor protein MotB [Terracidiphilus sp.]|jgi:chemotaxis protein MotB|nr:flagellar motor protein MotB [Terracidiphilus sp.]